MYLKLAWRNIWRKKRRTAITIAAISISVTLASFYQGVQFGSYDAMIRNTIGKFSGYIQIHQKDYIEEPIIDNSFEIDDKMLDNFKKVENVIEATPRIETFALVSSGKQSKPILVTGIDPKRENAIIDLKQKLKKGKYFKENDTEAAIISEGLAKFLKLDVNDSIVVIGSGYHASMAVGKYYIRGIAKFPTKEIDDRSLWLDLQTMQEFVSAYGLATTVAIAIKNTNKLESTKQTLKQKIAKNKELVLQDWLEFAPEISQTIEVDRAGNYLMLFILYMVVSFGIFGTVLMMTEERKNEFGILTAIGMGRKKLAFLVFLETLLLNIFGALVGILIAMPLVSYFHFNPIPITDETMSQVMHEYGMEAVIYVSNDMQIFFTQTLIVFIVALVTSLYPVTMILKLKTIKAMRA